MLLNLFGYLSDGRAPLVEVLRPILFFKIETFGKVRDIIFVPSLILFVENGTPNQGKGP